MIPTSPGAAMNVPASAPSTVARQPGSKATLSTTAAGRCALTLAVNVPSSSTAACAVTRPGVDWVTPITRVTGAGARPAYSSDASSPDLSW
jgi:hypothetical protein